MMSCPLHSKIRQNLIHQKKKKKLHKDFIKDTYRSGFRGLLDDGSFHEAVEKIIDEATPYFQQCTTKPPSSPPATPVPPSIYVDGPSDIDVPSDGIMADHKPVCVTSETTAAYTEVPHKVSDHGGSQWTVICRGTQILNANFVFSK